LKQKSASPWDNIEEKYPVRSVVHGVVVNVMSYRACGAGPGWNV